MLPVALPWLAALLLLLLQPNRSLRAWCIFAPVLCLIWGVGLLPDLFPSIPWQVIGVLHDLVIALAFGLAAAWLLSAYIKSRFRTLNALRLALIIEALGFATYVFSVYWSESESEAAPVAIILALSAAIIPAATGLAGLLCWRRYRPVVLCAWLLVMLFGLWLAVVWPLFMIENACRGNAPAWVFMEPVLAITAACFCAVLPFLLLSFWNRLYRERLIQLLRLAPEPPPAPAAPTPPVSVLSPSVVERLKAAVAAAPGHGALDPAKQQPTGK